VEKYAPALQGYNMLLQDKGLNKPRLDSQPQRAKTDKGLEEKIGADLLSYQAMVIKYTPGIEMVFLKGDVDIDNKVEVSYDSTKDWSVEKIVSRFKADTGSYALVADNGNGMIMYKRGGMKLKERGEDGTFGKAKIITNQFYQNVIDTHIDKAFDFD